jgi:hypothetical protein
MEHGGTEEVTAACAFLLPFRPASRMPWLPHILPEHAAILRLGFEKHVKPTQSWQIPNRAFVPNLHYTFRRSQ